MATLHLRPRGFSELIDATFQIVRARFRVLATGAALIMLPIMALSLLMLAFMPQPQLGPNGTLAPAAPRDEVPTAVWIALAVVGVASIWSFVVGYAALVHVASRAYLGEAAEIGPAIAAARTRFWTLLRAVILKYLGTIGLVMVAAMAVGVMAAISPWLAGLGGLGALAVVLAVLAMWSMSTPIVVMEGTTGARAAISRSTALTRGSRLRLLGMAVVMVVIFYAGLAMFMMGGLLLLRSPIAAQVLTNLFSLVMYPTVAVLMTVVYYDLRIRNEGFDLELMAQGLEQGAVLPSAVAPGSAAGSAAGSASRQPA